MRVIYIDLLLAVNFLIDCLLLRATAAVCGQKLSLGRLLGAAALAAASALLILLPQIKPLPLAAVKLCCLAAVTVAAFGAASWARFARDFICFGAVNLVFGGAAYLAAELLDAGVIYNNTAFYFDSRPLMLVALMTAVYLVVRAVYAWWRGRAPQAAAAQLKLCGEKGVYRCTALVDTGAKVCDALSGRPVILLSPQAAARLFDKKQLEFAANCAGDGSGLKFRLIPYDSLGGQGLLVAYALRSCEIEYSGTKKQIEEPLAAVCTRQTGFEAIISYDAIKEM